MAPEERDGGGVETRVVIPPHQLQKVALEPRATARKARLPIGMEGRAPENLATGPMPIMHPIGRVRESTARLQVDPGRRPAGILKPKAKANRPITNAGRDGALPMP